jgi:hypothetical protein
MAEPPPFFVPDAGDESEDTLLAIYAQAERTLGWKADPLRRIWRLEYRHNGVPMEAEVGLHDADSGEVVYAILDTPQSYLVCTTTRGVVSGTPILVGKRDASSVIAFSS